MNRHSGRKGLQFLRSHAVTEPVAVDYRPMAQLMEPTPKNSGEKPDVSVRMRAIRKRREELYGADRNEAQLPAEVAQEALELQAQFADAARRAS